MSATAVLLPGLLILAVVFAIGVAMLVTEARSARRAHEAEMHAGAARRRSRAALLRACRNFHRRSS